MVRDLSSIFVGQIRQRGLLSGLQRRGRKTISLRAAVIIWTSVCVSFFYHFFFLISDFYVL